MMKVWRNKIAIIALCLAGLGMSSCKSKKLMTVPDVGITQKTVISEAAKARMTFDAESAKVDLQFDSFNAKAKVNLSMDGREIPANLNLRIKKDEIIWASVSLFGMEGARALITPDSVKVLVRLGKNDYIAESFDFIQQKTSKRVDFKMLQAILVGNKVESPGGRDDVFTVADLFYILSGKEEGYNYEFRYNGRYKPDSFLLQDLTQTLSVTYAEYGATDSGSGLVPMVITISSQAAGKTFGVDLRYNKVSVNETQEYPFSIPQRFN